MFHVFGEMPELAVNCNCEYRNQLRRDSIDCDSVACGRFATTTMHIMLKDTTKITADACVFHYNNSAVALNGLGTTYEDVQAAYKQPTNARPGPGGWGIKESCEQQVALARQAGQVAPDSNIAPLHQVLDDEWREDDRPV